MATGQNDGRVLALALAQLNPTVGDLVGNTDMVIEAANSALTGGARIVLFPELMISGYPPEDLVLREDFLVAAEVQLTRLARETAGITVLVGYPQAHTDGVANSMAVLAGGEIKARYRKQLLPNYGVFDEQRYFVAGSESRVIELDGLRLGLTICEDAWSDQPVCAAIADQGADLIVNASASPFHIGKARDREAMLSARAKRFGIPIAYCNLVGGQDELVFDGSSVVVGAAGEILARGNQFQTDLVHLSIELDRPARVPEDHVADLPIPGDRGDDQLQETYGAIVLGIRDYVEKNGFPGVIIGVSGGLDSALVMSLASDALGSDRVLGVTMPSRFNSEETQSDAKLLIDRLGSRSEEFAIERLMEAFDSTLADAFAGSARDQTEENIQARIRGTLLMALSNKFGSIVLTTGNKSETAVGYSTLYGDMAGGFAPLKDVPKQLAFRLARWRNTNVPDGSRCSREDPIPTAIIERPPSAELSPDQTDEATLGSYEQLDAVIERYVEQDQGLDEIASAGIDRDFAKRILRMIDLAEYKRRQAPPGVKVTTRAFGRDRRMPITARRNYGSMNTPE
jgi:NAD+ synthase (glutamine-hydrolysing)